MPDKVIKTENVFSGRAVKLRVETIEKSNGQVTTREIVEHADCIAVVPIDENGNVVMVKQYREAVGKYLLEIPAGCIEPGETPSEAVKRELQEEIGYIPERIEALGGFYATPGYVTEYLYLFKATELKPSRLVAEDTEEIEVIKVPVSKIPALITSGEIGDTKSIAGLLKILYLNK